MKIGGIMISTSMLLVLENSSCWTINSLSSPSSVPVSPALRRIRPVALQMTPLLQINNNYRDQFKIEVTDTPTGVVVEEEDDDVDVIMKFGGSALANADEVEHVAQRIKGELEAGYRPREIICSSLGKTTKTLLRAALQGRTNIEEIRRLHKYTMIIYNMPQQTRREVNRLLDECEFMLKSMKQIPTLSSESLGELVKCGERCSVRIIAARLNQIGVPARSFDNVWDGQYTNIATSNIVAVITASDFNDHSAYHYQMEDDHEDDLLGGIWDQILAHNNNKRGGGEKDFYYPQLQSI